MKFSVLLPTRNRLDLLSYAIKTVRDQDYDDWEIIVSDNFSEEDIAGYVRSLQDPRVKYFRTNDFIPVTDNWNNALEKSDGDYVIMLGDDDCLMKGYFTTIRQLANDYDAPEVIYSSAFLYAYPGVMPTFPDGFLQPYGYADFLLSADQPFILEKHKALALLEHSLNFRVRFGYNMQFSTVSRRFIQSLAKYGPFYQSPYPDYYASNVMMLKAKHILVTPMPLVTIGISPKSFGYYYFNELEDKGVEFLKNLTNVDMAKRLENVIMPGTEMNTSWLVSMETIRVNFSEEVALRVNYRRYRLIQILFVLLKCTAGEPGTKSIEQKLWKRMSTGEKCLYGYPVLFLKFLSSVFPKRYRDALANKILAALGTHPRFVAPKIAGNYRTILDVFEKVDPGLGKNAQAHEKN
ncbi:MAG: glycosyltransferase family A protein [Candidatus Ozemobacteraceae bacterium]